LKRRLFLCCISVAASSLSPQRGSAAESLDVPVAPGAFHCSPEQQAFLDRLQHDTFQFFWESSRSDNGLTPDRAPGAEVSSVAAVGFALTSYLVGVEKGYVSREAAAQRTLSTLRTLWSAPQGPMASGVAGYNGLFYHFLDEHDGLRTNQSELSTVDTALLMAGVLAAQTFFDEENDAERSIRSLSDRLYRRVDWSWAYSTRNRPLLSMGWSPEHGFLEADWRGYNEGMILYLLALGSPTHAIDPRAWEQWTRSYRVEGAEKGVAHVGFGPLFGHQYSHIWIDFRGIQDNYMRSKGTDYFVNSTRATYANRAYCIANPGRWKGYGESVWGLTASDGPVNDGRADPATPFHAYWARGPTPDGAEDDGTIAPTAVGGSVPFAPEVTIPTLLRMREQFGDHLYGQYGFKDAFNLSYPANSGEGWFDDQYLAIDQGPILLMIENYRTGFVWDLLKRNAYVTAGLKKAGFTGGWLASSDRPTNNGPRVPSVP